MATPVRPKQRVLVRWNDDLDKSLLLFITHTCTEMGIKIPYDEVARRMGSTFTEGAIQQHIAKLRTKMAELNVVPVPAAPKRGTVTTRPSGVYGHKTRAAPPVPNLQQRARSTTVGANAIDDEQVEQTATHGRRGRAKRQKIVIKRSESDVGESDEEREGGDEEEYTAQSSNKRRRSVRSKRNTQVSKVSNPKDQLRQAQVTEMSRRIDEADAQYDAQVAASDEHDEDVIVSIDNNEGPAANARGFQYAYKQFFPAGNRINGDDEEFEEEDEGTSNQTKANSQAPPYLDVQFIHHAQHEYVSPATRALTLPHQEPGTVPSNQMLNLFPPVTHNAQVEPQFGFNPAQVMPPPPNLSVNTQSFDFGNWSGFNINGYGNATGPLFQSPYPIAMNASQESIPMTRHPSTISNGSTQENNAGVQVPQTPNGHNHDATLPVFQPSPPNTGSFFEPNFTASETPGIAPELFMPQPTGAGGNFNIGIGANFDAESFFGGSFNFGDPNDI